MTDPYDIIICGAGITGASTAFHLKALGYRPLVLCNQPSITEKSMALAHAESGDQITRVANAFGDNQAKSLWELSLRGFNSLRDFCEEQSIPVQAGNIVRVAREEFEKRELAMGYDLLRDVHDNIKLVEGANELHGYTLQVLKDKLFKFDVCKLLNALLHEVETVRTQVQSINEKTDGVTVSSDTGNFHGELCIGASHLDIQSLFKLPPGALVPFSDQWSKTKILGNIPQALQGALVFWRYNLCQAYFGEGGQGMVSGARFVRPNAGIGDMVAKVSDRVQDMQLRELLELLPQGGFKLEEATHLLGCRPCDELPIVGPMFGSQRLLLGTGYMGQGLSLGFMAGKCLAELVHWGTCSMLPRILWPERLRALGES